MIAIQRNNERFFLTCSLLMITTYFAGCKRFIQYFQGATKKDLLGAAGVATLASGILRHENPKKSALLATSISLGTAAILKTLNMNLKWESSTFLKVGAVKAFILGGFFTQKKEYYKNGKLHYEGEWIEGQPHGHGKWYYHEKDGQLYYEGEWKKGKPDGHGKSYHENGKLRYEGEFKDGRFDGHGKYYYEDGQLYYEGEWKKGEAMAGRFEGKPDGHEKS